MSTGELVDKKTHILVDPTISVLPGILGEVSAMIGQLTVGSEKHELALKLTPKIYSVLAGRAEAGELSADLIAIWGQEEAARLIKDIRARQGILYQDDEEHEA